MSIEARKAAAAPCKLASEARGKADVLLAPLDRLTAAPSDEPAATSKEIIVAGNCPRWVIDKRTAPLLDTHDRGERGLSVGGRRRGWQIERGEDSSVRGRVGIDFENDAILVDCV